MKFRNLDVNDDWDYGRGLQSYRLDNAAILLDLGTRLRSFLGDCFFSRADGIDWFGLLGLKNSQDTLGLEIRRIINTTDGVVAINDFNLTYDSDTRIFSLEYNIDTVFTENQYQLLNNVGA